MSLNLREVQRRYGRNKGLSLKAVQSYTHQVSEGVESPARGVPLFPPVFPKM
jgi:hypothetical protein